MASAGAAVLLALPGLAHAGARADYRQTFTTSAPGTSTGMVADILYKHPDDAEAKPIPVRQEVFTFPEGTTFDGLAVPDCTATDAELQLMGEAACPPDTRLGAGEGGTFMSGFGGETPMDVDIFDDGPGSVVLGGSREPPIRFATRARRQGRVVTVNVPHLPGGPPDGESAIRKVHNVVEPHTMGDHAYFRTPPVCPVSGVWRWQARFTFADGAVEENVYDQPCDRDAAKPRIRVRGVPRRRCATRGFGVRVLVTDTSPIARVRLRLDGRLLRSTDHARSRTRIRAGRLLAGRHRLTVVARDAAGNRSRRSVRFRRCRRARG